MEWQHILDWNYIW